MSGKGLLKRVLLTLVLAVGCAIFLAVVDAQATPIRPDIRKIVNQPQENEPKTIPARAGWEGPEMAQTQVPAMFASGILSGERLARARRAELIAAATPDPRAILGITAVILLLRLLRQQEQRRLRPRLVGGNSLEDHSGKIAA